MTVTDNLDDLEQRRDSSLKQIGFLAWLQSFDRGGEWEPLQAAILDTKRPTAYEGTKAYSAFPRKFDFDVYANRLTEIGHADLVPMLTNAAVEWRSDKIALERLKRVLEVNTDSTGDYRLPDVSPTCSWPEFDCDKDVVPGTRRCRRHGGELIDPVERRHVLFEAYSRIVGASEKAVQALVEIAVSGRNEVARVTAAKEILDRAGLTAELQISVRLESDGRAERISEVQKKLLSMQQNLQARVIDAQSAEVTLTQE